MEEDSTPSEDKPSVEGVLTLLAAMKQVLPRRLEIRSLATKFKLPFKAVALSELLIHRIVDIGGEAIGCLQKGVVGPAVVLARAVIETTSVLAALHSLVERVIETESVDDSVDSTLMRVLFGSRARQTSESAINIITQIDKLDKRFSGIRWWYDQLSEMAHPNYLGLLGSYGDIDRENFLVDFGPTDDYRDFGPAVCLPALQSSLEIFRLYYDELADMLPRFIEVCDSSLSAATDDTIQTDS